MKSRPHLDRATDPATTVLLADRLFTGLELLESAAVSIREGRIESVRPAPAGSGAALVDAEAGIDVVRLRGCTLAPGLIDAHVHLAPWMVFGLLAAGVTTARDCGNDVEAVRPLLDALDLRPLPTIEWCGPLMEGARANWPSVARRHTTVTEIEATVAESAARGHRAIKLYANATPALTAAAARAARRHDMRVLCHLGATDLAAAAEAGVDELQHLAGCLAADLDLPVGDAVEALLGTPVDHCPTLVVWQGLALLGGPRDRRDDAARWAPPAMHAAWAASHHASQPADERLQRLGQLVERMRLIAPLLAAGRRIVVGSDTPFAGSVPGWSLHDEAGLLVQAGMRELAVLTALTSGNADALGLTGQRGVVAPGAAADLVAFGGDPTARIGDLSDVRAVWKDGVAIDLEALATAAADAFADPTASPFDDIARRRFIPATMI